MKRRDFLTLLSASAAAPHTAFAQRGDRVARVGCLVTGSPESHGAFVAALRQGLVQHGLIEGRDFSLEVRWAAGRLDRLPALLDELARLAPDVVVTATAVAAVAAKKAMPAVPIVSATLADPIGLGLAASFNNPGGTVTGILFTVDGLAGKQLQMARQLAPGARRIGMLLNMGNPSNVVQRRDAEAAAPVLGLDLVPVEVRAPEDVDAALATLTREGSELAIVFADAVLVTGRHRIAELAIAAKLPTMYGLREFAEAGGLLSYGIHVRENWRRAAYFVDRILKGDKPATLPIEQPTRFELVINLKTAKALGLEMPPTLLALADEVIE